MRLMLGAIYLLLAGTLAAQEPAATTTITSRHLEFSSDGFSIRLQSQLQFRFTWQDERAQSGSGGSNGRDFANFRVARAKMDLQGHIFESAFQYRFRLNWARPITEVIEIARMRLAWIKYLNVNAGQAPMAWNWEEQVDSTDLNFQERSYANEVFNQDYAKGVWIDGEFGDEAPWIRYWFGVYNGVLKAQDDFRNADGALTSDSFSNLIDNELQVTLRAETHPLGLVQPGMADTRDEAEYEKILFAIGLGASLLFSGVDNEDLRMDEGVSATASGRGRVRQETLAVTLDGHFRFYGIGADAAFYWRHTDFHNRGSNHADVSGRQGIGDLEDMGWSFEASYMFTFIDIAVAFRVSSVDADEFWGANAALQQTDVKQRGIRPDAMEYTFGASYLLQGERLKFSLDITYIDQQLVYSYDGGATVTGVYNDPVSRNGLLGSSRPNADHDVLWIVRAQVQWLF